MLRLNATTARERHAVVAELNTGLAAAGAWVTDFQQFSNVSVCIGFEIEGRFLRNIEYALAGVSVPSSSRTELRELVSTTEQAVSVKGTLQVTFFHSERDLRVPVPAVPG